MPGRYDVLIVGGGAAGLSAALVLGRCRRGVVLYDDGQHRNEASHAIHCLLGQEGTPPRELYGIARAEVQKAARWPCQANNPPWGTNFLQHAMTVP